MTAAERERLFRTTSGEASYRAGVALKCAVCAALIGLLVLIGAGQQDRGDVASNASVGSSQKDAGDIAVNVSSASSAMVAP